jgi:hypothetical protein
VALPLSWVCVLTLIMAAAYSLGDPVPRRVRWISEPLTWCGQSGSTNKEARCSTCPTCSRNFISGTRQTNAIGTPGRYQWNQQSRCSDCLPEYLRKQKNTRQKRYRGRHRVERQATCEHCSATFAPQRSTARFCSTACRAAAHRQQKEQP